MILVTMPTKYFIDLSFYGTFYGCNDQQNVPIHGRKKIMFSHTNSVKGYKSMFRQIEIFEKLVEEFLAHLSQILIIKTLLFPLQHFKKESSCRTQSLQHLDGINFPLTPYTIPHSSLSPSLYPIEIWIPIVYFLSNIYIIKLKFIFKSSSIFKRIKLSLIYFFTSINTFKQIVYEARHVRHKRLDRLKRGWGLLDSDDLMFWHAQ